MGGDFLRLFSEVDYGDRFFFFFFRACARGMAPWGGLGV